MGLVQDRDGQVADCQERRVWNRPDVSGSECFGGERYEVLRLTCTEDGRDPIGKRDVNGDGIIGSVRWRFGM